MKIEVISLGGSLIIPKATDTIDYQFLNKLQKILTSFKNKRFVVVVGGGATARKYINALGANKVDKKRKCLIGVGITRLNARFLTFLFSKTAAPKVPTSLKEIKQLINKYKIVFAGGLTFEEDNTSDGTAAQIANYLKTDFINITDVKGLYTKDPRKHKDARLVSRISFKDFDKLVSKMQYHPGQHFILDQHAAKIIKRHKVKTFIVGKDLKNIKNCLQDKDFVGTVIS